jgi:hypothetical protein
MQTTDVTPGKVGCSCFNGQSQNSTHTPPVEE